MIEVTTDRQLPSLKFILNVKITGDVFWNKRVWNTNVDFKKIHCNKLSTPEYSKMGRISGASWRRLKL